MRIALRVVSALTIVFMAGGAGLFFGFSSQNGLTTNAGALGMGTGGLLALATGILGIMAPAQRRQYGWLVAVIAAALTSICGAPLGALVGHLLIGTPPLPASCQNLGGTPGVQPTISPECQQAVQQSAPTGGEAALLTGSALLFLLGPILVGLVGLIYSFRMRDPAAVVPPAHA